MTHEHATYLTENSRKMARIRDVKGNINRLPLSLNEVTSLSGRIWEENKDKDNWNVRHMDCSFFPQYKNRDLI